MAPREEEEGHRRRGEKGPARRAPFSRARRRARRGMAKRRGGPVTSRDSRSGAASLSLGRRRSARSVHRAHRLHPLHLAPSRDLLNFALSKTRRKPEETENKKGAKKGTRRDSSGGHIRTRTEVLNGNDNCAIARWHEYTEIANTR